jgi:Fe-S-cluster containining protein
MEFNKINPVDRNNVIKFLVEKHWPQHKSITKEELGRIVGANFDSVVNDVFLNQHADIHSLKLMRNLISYRQSTVEGISCSKGCSFCCHVHVSISKMEADILAKKFKTKLLLSSPYLISQSKMQKFTDRDSNYTACVFLDPITKSCMCYDDRPLNCRKHIVASPPELCDTVKYPRGGIGVFGSLDLDTFLAAFELLYESGPMAQMLLESLSEMGVKGESDN